MTSTGDDESSLMKDEPDLIAGRPRSLSTGSPMSSPKAPRPGINFFSHMYLFQRFLICIQIYFELVNSVVGAAERTDFQVSF